MGKNEKKERKKYTEYKNSHLAKYIEYS